MKSSSKRIGVHGAGGKIAISREDIAVSRQAGPVGSGMGVVAIDIGAVPMQSIREDALLDIVIRDGRTNQSHLHPIGRLNDIDRSAIRIEVPNQMLGSKTGIFVQVVDPASDRFLATSERVFLPAVNSNVEGNGDEASAASPIMLRIDPDQRRASKAVFDDLGPVICFGRHGPATAVEAKRDSGSMAHALPNVLQVLVAELLSPSGAGWQGTRWDGFRALVAEGTGYRSWDELAAAQTASPALAADGLIDRFLPESRLEKMIEALVQNASRASCAYDQE